MGGKNPNVKLERPLKSENEAPVAERILDAAIDPFAEKGFAGSSVRDIAKAVGLSERALR